MAEELAHVGRVIAYDRRGYSRSGGEPVRSIPRHTSDAAAILDSLHAEQAVVAGTSVGATPAQADRWVRLVMAAYAQLLLARPLTADLVPCSTVTN